ncbi:hypothetical protein [Roseovarius sp. 2305UL8-3]|uniref:hypothetical protein n=1 Tax=Roseovarius conchicola TaxID=3121636 RepID=UPI0035288684
MRGSGNGYQKLRNSSRIRKNGDGKPGVDASYLNGRHEITASSFTRVSTETRNLGLFSQDRIHDPRSLDLFGGPLLIVHEAPPVMTGRIGVSVSDKDVVFNQSFYGYSPLGFSEAKILVRYLALVFGSELVTWIALMTSGRFGVEREAIEKATLDRIPIPDFRKLTRSQKEEISTLFEGLKTSEQSWGEVDRWVAELYGLGSRDLQVISDTLQFSLPYAQNKRDAQASPTKKEQARFCSVLATELQPWCERFGSKVSVCRIDLPASSPWYGIKVQTAYADNGTSAGEDDWEGLMRAADDAAASEVILRDREGALLIGRLAQRRYWSETQARLLAQRIAWSHIDLLHRKVDA